MPSLDAQNKILADRNSASHYPISTADKPHVDIVHWLIPYPLAAEISTRILNRIAICIACKHKICSLLHCTIPYCSIGDISLQRFGAHKHQWSFQKYQKLYFWVLKKNLEKKSANSQWCIPQTCKKSISNT
jgi:hypothetical protein